MPRAREEADEFEEGIKAYGMGADQIIRYSDDVDAGTIGQAIHVAEMKIADYAKQGRRTLLLFFYIGHGFTGCCDTDTEVLLNSNIRGGKAGYQYPLGDYLFECNKQPGAYVISLIKCGRRTLPKT